MYMDVRARVHVFVHVSVRFRFMPTYSNGLKADLILGSADKDITVLPSENIILSGGCCCPKLMGDVTPVTVSNQLHP